MSLFDDVDILFPIYPTEVARQIVSDLTFRGLSENRERFGDLLDAAHVEVEPLAEVDNDCDDAPMPHGDGCGCDDCVEAAFEYQRGFRESKSSGCSR